MPLIQTPDVTIESFLVRVAHDTATVFLRYGVGETMQGRPRNFGTLCIHSDYGTHGHHFHSTGPEFREFLCGVGADYLTSKLGRLGRNYEDAAATLIREVRLARRQGRIDVEAAAEAIEAIRSAHADYGDSEAMLVALHHTNALPSCIDTTEMFPSEWDRDTRMFVNRMWPEIARVMRERLNEQAGCPALTGHDDADDATR